MVPNLRFFAFPKMQVGGGPEVPVGIAGGIIVNLINPGLGVPIEMQNRLVHEQLGSFTKMRRLGEMHFGGGSVLPIGDGVSKL